MCLSKMLMAKCLHVCVLSASVVPDSLQSYGPMAHQAPLSMGFSRQEYWSGMPFSSLGDLLVIMCMKKVFGVRL